MDADGIEIAENYASTDSDEEKFGSDYVEANEIDDDALIKVVVRSSDNDGTVCMLSNRRLSTALLRPADAKKAFYDVTVFGAAAPGQDSSELVGIRAHKWVLCSVSAHLLELFSSDDYTDSNKAVYKFDNIRHDTLNNLVELVYTDKLVFDTDCFNRVQNLLITAKYLIMNDIADACETFFCSRPQLNLENYVTMWRFARKYLCFALMEASSIGIANKLADVMRQNNFLNLTFDEITKVLLCGAVIVADADLRCLAAAAWLNHDAENRAKHARDIINMVPAEVGSISRSTIAELCDSDVLFAEMPELFRRILSHSVKCSKPEPFSTRDELLEKPMAGFMQRDAWSVVGGFEEACDQFVQYDVLRRHWETRPQLPWVREGAGVCLLQDRLVVLGGRRNRTNVACINEYKFATSTWIENGKKLRYCRADYAACSDDNNNAYCFGGNRMHTSGFVERYSIVSNDAIVTKLANMPVGCSSASATYDHSNYAVFVAGGVNSTIATRSSEKLKSIHHYDIFSDKWTLAGNMKAARAGLASALIEDDLYLAGGCGNDNKGELDIVEVLNVRTGKIRKVPKMIHRRDGCRAVALDKNVLCVLGGWGEECTRVRSVEVFDKREGKTWTTGEVVPDMPPNGSGYFGFAASAQ